MRLDTQGGGAPTDANYVVTATNGTLTNERVLAVSGGLLTLTDSGAGSNVTVGLTSDAVNNTISPGLFLLMGA